MNRLLCFILGTKRYSVKCSAPSRICGRLMARFPEAVTYARVTGECGFVFSCLCPAVGKTEDFLCGYECERCELGTYGMPRYMGKLVRRPGMIIGFVLAMVCAIYLNGVIWDIEVSGNEKIGDNEIINTLADLNLAVGRPYSREELSAVCNNFILKDDRFTRIAVNMSGNVAFVEVTERTKKSETEKAPSNSGILSAYDCIIERPEAVSGTSLVSKGQAVEKGTLLISPVEKGNDGTEYISGAKGRVYGKTIERFTVTVPHNVNKTIYDKISHKRCSVSFLGLQTQLPECFDDVKGNFICTIHSERVRLAENIVLPFKIRSMEKRAYTTEMHTLTSTEAEEKAYRIMYAKITRDLAECEILSTEFELSEDEGYTVLSCTVECIRDVAMCEEK